MAKTNAGKLTNAPLQKGNACSRCRLAKIRCSGEKPVCSSCIRSARFLGKPIESINCLYGLTKGKGKGKGVKVKVSKVKITKLKAEKIEEEEVEIEAMPTHTSMNPLIELENTMASLQRVIQDNLRNSAVRPHPYASTSDSSSYSPSQTGSSTPNELESENEFWTRYSSGSSSEALNSPPDEAKYPIYSNQINFNDSYFSILPYQTQVLVPPSPFYEPWGVTPSNFTNASHVMDTLALPVYNFATGPNSGTLTPFGRLTTSEETAFPWNGSVNYPIV